MTKMLNKLGIQGNYLNIIRAIFDQPKANILPNGENVKDFLFSKIRNKAKMTLPWSFFSYIS